MKKIDKKYTNPTWNKEIEKGNLSKWKSILTCSLDGNIKRFTGIISSLIHTVKENTNKMGPDQLNPRFI